MHDPRRRRAVVVADGDVPTADELDHELLAAADGERVLVIAADGGLRKAQALGLRPDAVVGDGDSLAPALLAELAAGGVDVHLHPRAKDASDTELAIREAVRRGADEIAVLGALGGVRFDHALANVLLLAAPDIVAKLRLVDGATTVHVLGRHGAEQLALSGVAGDVVSLLPLSAEVSGVTVAGLEYPLDGATLRQGPTLGLSNVLAAPHATIAVESGRLAVIHVHQRGAA